MCLTSQALHRCPCEEPAAAQGQLREKPHCTLFSLQDSIPVSTSLLGDTSDTTSTGLAQRLGTYPGGCRSGQMGPRCVMES